MKHTQAVELMKCDLAFHEKETMHQALRRMYKELNALGNDSQELGLAMQSIDLAALHLRHALRAAQEIVVGKLHHSNHA